MNNYYELNHHEEMCVLYEECQRWTYSLYSDPSIDNESKTNIKEIEDELVCLYANVNFINEFSKGYYWVGIYPFN